MNYSNLFTDLLKSQWVYYTPVWPTTDLVEARVQGWLVGTSQEEIYLVYNCYLDKLGSIIAAVHSNWPLPLYSH